MKELVNEEDARVKKFLEENPDATWDGIKDSMSMDDIPIPRCPKCGKPMDRRYIYTNYGSDVVSEVNYSKQDGEIGYYSIWECSSCTTKYDHNQLISPDANSDLLECES